jgi:hypothetical protein
MYTFEIGWRILATLPQRSWQVVRRPVQSVRRDADVKMVIEKDTKQGYDSKLKVWYTHNPVKRQLWDLSCDRPLPATAEGYYNNQPAIFRAEAMVISPIFSSYLIFYA